MRYTEFNKILYVICRVIKMGIGSKCKQPQKMQMCTVQGNMTKILFINLKPWSSGAIKTRRSSPVDRRPSTAEAPPIGKIYPFSKWP